MNVKSIIKIFVEKEIKKIINQLEKISNIIDI